MREQTFTLLDASITVREEFGSDQWDAETVLYVLGDSISDHPAHRINKFIDAVVRSTVSGSLGFEWPQSVLDRTRMLPAYEAWRRLSKGDLKRWDTALTQINEPPGDPAQHPMDIPPGESSLPK